MTTTGPPPAVVPAAGRGRRLGALTARRPKPLVPVAGRPVLGWVLGGLAQAGIEEVVVVTGYLGEQIEAATPALAPGLAVRCVRQHPLLGTGHAVLTARSALGGGPFVFAWGDVLVPPATYREVLERPGAGEGAIAVNRVDDPHAGAAVVVEGGRVRDLVEKPPSGSAPSTWNSTGVGFLPARAWGLLESIQPSPRGEIELTDLLRLLAGEGLLWAVPVAGPVFDIGTPASVAAARAWASGPPGSGS